MNSNFTDFFTFVRNVSLSRTNRYLVEITGPSNANVNDGISHANISFMCDYVSHPAFTLHTKDASLYGAPDMRPDGGIDYHNVVGMSFLLDESQRVKTYFTNWLNLIVNRDTYFVGYRDEYISNVIKIHQLDMADNITYTTELYDIYPVELGSVDATSQIENQFSRLNVQFNFRTWKSFVRNSAIDQQKQLAKYSNI